MDLLLTLFTMAGGLGLFLYGMSIMGSSLKKAAGAKLEGVLARLSSTPLKGLLLGTFVTAAIQSSSATTVMVVGFVNSGIMNLSQAMGVVMGANIGTTVTGWLLSTAGIGGGVAFLQLLKPSSFAPVLVFVGTIVYMFTKNPKRKSIATIIVGFGALLMGMNIMSDAAAPFSESPIFMDTLTVFSNPFLGVLIGTIFTAVLQSSSATIGILQALSMSGAISYATAIPLIMGMNIGASVPVLLSGFGASTEGKRTSIFYLYFNLFSAAIFMIPFYIINAVSPFEFMASTSSPVGIALFNSAVKVAVGIIMLPMVNLFRKLVCATVKEKEQHNGKEDIGALLDDRFLNIPAIAVEQCQKCTNIMREMAVESLIMSIGLLTNYDNKSAEIIEEIEEEVDRCEDKIGSYLVKLSGCNLSETESHEAASLIHTISDFERISDHAINIRDVAEEIHEKKVSMSPEAQKELSILTEAIKEVLDLTSVAFSENDKEKACKVEPLEEVIDIMCEILKSRHVERLQKGKCSITNGFILNDILTNYERVADHCSNVAITVIRAGSGSYDQHEYVERLDKTDNGDFHRNLELYSQKYVENL